MGTLAFIIILTGRLCGIEIKALPDVLEKIEINDPQAQTELDNLLLRITDICNDKS